MGGTASKVPNVIHQMADLVAGEVEQSKEQSLVRLSPGAYQAFKPLQRQGKQQLHAKEPEQCPGDNIAWEVNAEIDPGEADEDQGPDIGDGSDPPIDAPQAGREGEKDHHMIAGKAVPG